MRNAPHGFLHVGFSSPCLASHKPGLMDGGTGTGHDEIVLRGLLSLSSGPMQNTAGATTSGAIESQGLVR